MAQNPADLETPINNTPSTHMDGTPGGAQTSSEIAQGEQEVSMFHYQPTPETQAADYAKKARSLFNRSQQLRGRYSRILMTLMVVILVMGSLNLALYGKESPLKIWILILNWLLVFVLLTLRLDKKVADHAMTAMQSLVYAHKFEHMTQGNNYKDLPINVEMFERHCSDHRYEQVFILF
jgi:hypothetical protein